MEVERSLLGGDSAQRAWLAAIRKPVLAKVVMPRPVVTRAVPSTVLLAVAAVIGMACLGVSGGGGAVGAGAGQNTQSLFIRACDLYEAGDFASAGDDFEAIRATGLRNAVVEYNLGNCFYKQGQLGKAVVNYRRALMLSPRDGDARANLDLIRSVVGSGDTTVAYGAAGAGGFPMRLASPRQLQTLSYIAYYLAVVFFVGVLFLAERWRRVAIYGLILSAVVAGLGFGLSSHSLSKIQSSSDAVIIVDRAGLKSGPGPAFDEVSTLPDGLELRQRAKSGIWVEVQLPTGEVGWVRGEDIERI